MSKRIRAVMLSMVTVCLCLALVIGGTYALFSDQVTVQNHLQAGKLEVGLFRVGYTANELTEDGVLSEGETDKERLELTDTTTEDITLFSVTDAVPGCWYRVDLEVANNGNIAFNYGVRMIWDRESATPEQVKFAGQMQITVEVGDVQKAQFFLSDAAAAEDIDLGSIFAKGEAQQFTVTAKFMDSDENNDVQKISLEFDLQVFATQKTTNN